MVNVSSARSTVPATSSDPRSTIPPTSYALSRDVFEVDGEERYVYFLRAAELSDTGRVEPTGPKIPIAVDSTNSITLWAAVAEQNADNPEIASIARAELSSAIERSLIPPRIVSSVE
jgi:hypothetical protein